MDAGEKCRLASGVPLLSLSKRSLTWAPLVVLLLWISWQAMLFDPTRRPFLLGDEATYLMQAESLAWDGDLRFEARDLERFRRLHPWPPEVILQSGDGGQRVTFGKPFLYAAAIAPFVRLFGENGATGANAIFLAVSTLLAALALSRSRAVAGPLWATVFVFASVSFAHVYWVHSDLFYMCTSASGLAESSECQNATSSAMTPITVYPRTARKFAVWTSIVIPFVRWMVSFVIDSTICASIGTPSRNALMYPKATRA